ncbi:MAG TPA: cytochrome c maturation protein CcmE [Anaerolineae bacterium]|nr:cytochrome c maturation protein CcmE [Anaerolineae bacterium]HOQ99989.1 cytochrome c maturation protein CcmE [Anaerolineae bacterium]HPL30043.1 cytochrome c maturation protein CcmE [Anaerolineae bacterium]
MAQVTDWAAGAKRKGPPKKILIAGLVAVAAMAYLIIFGMRGATVYSMTVAELTAQGQAAVGQGVRVSGLLDEASVSFDPQAVILSFSLTGDGATLPVVYHGVKPDNMQDDAEVIAEGKLRADGTLEATRLLFKCPSKYESGTPAASSPSRQPMG